MATELQGIEALKKGVKFAVDLAKQFQESAKDGLTWMDSFSFIDELAEGAAVLKNGQQIVAELRDLSVTERGELYAYIQVEFDLENDKVEAIVEDSLNVAFSMLSLVEKIRSK